MKAASISPAISFSAATCGGNPSSLADDRFGPGPFQDVEREGSSAASLGADRHALSGERSERSANPAAAEQPQGLVADRAESFDARGFGAFGGAVLQQRHAHARLRVAEQPQILEAPRRRRQFQVNPGPGQDCAVAAAQFVVGAPLGSCRHDDRPRRQRCSDIGSRGEQNRQDRRGREVGPVSLEQRLRHHWTRSRRSRKGGRPAFRRPGTVRLAP